MKELVRAAWQRRCRTNRAVFCVIFRSFARVVLAIPFGWFIMSRLAMNDLDRKALAATAALERLPVGEGVDPTAAALAAELAVTPANCPEMVDASLLVLEGVRRVEKALKVRDHGVATWIKRSNAYPQFGSSTYIGPTLSVT